MLGSGYFAVDEILPSEVIFLLFIYVEIVIFAIILVMHGVVESVAAFKCDCYGFEFSLAGYLDKGSVHWGGTWNVNAWWRVPWGTVFLICQRKLPV